MEREPPLPWSISAATSTRNWIRIGWTREPGNFMRLLCFSSFRGKRSLSLPPPSFLAPSSLPPSLPPSLSLSRVTSAPGIPRLRRYERQRRKSERASWAAKRRGVVNDSSEPRSAFLPRALSLSPSLPLPVLRYFLSLQLCGPVAAWERVSRPKASGKRAFVRSFTSTGGRESMSYGRRNFWV